MSIMSETSWISIAHKRILLKYPSDFVSAFTRTDQKKVLKNIRKALQGAGHEVAAKYTKARNQTVPVCPVVLSYRLLFTSMQTVQKWYNNHVQGDNSDGDSDDYERKKWQKRWTLRNVTSHLRKEEINATIGVNPGSPMYMGKYSSALTSVVNGLAENDRREYMKLAEQWNREEPPKDIKRRYV
jgi:hypothetical protein